MKSFEGFPNITHLSLLINYSSINETFLKDIHIYLPDLQLLKLSFYSRLDSKELIQKMYSMIREVNKLEIISFYRLNECQFSATFKTKYKQKL